jgi:hypothetical protein
MAARAALLRALRRGAVGLGVVALATSIHAAALYDARWIHDGDTVVVRSLGRMVDRFVARF